MPQDDLEPLITECPSCQTRFRVVEAQLQRARGRVRCGACLTVFDGVERLVLDSDTAPDEAVTREALDDLLDELAGTTAPSGDQPEPSTAAAAVAERQVDEREPTSPSVTVAPEPARDAAASDEPSAAAEKADEPPLVAAEPESGEKAVAPAPEPVRPAEQPVAPARPAASAGASIAAPGSAPASKPAAVASTSKPAAAPSATEAAAPTASASEPAPAIFFGEERNRRPWVWGGIAAGLVLLAVQILWYQFDAWAVRPEWRGVYSFACGLLGCELPAQRDLSLLSTRNLVVRSDPERPGRLMVDAVIVNAADFPQPFPVLELQFTSLRGNLVASRRYHPDEYLAGDATGLTLIPARTPVQIALGLDDPGPDAVNYQLNFR